ncbi:MAG: recombinase family protein [Lentisphaeria bacterium]|nr:recombinase family protein [Lentisphaeria bacterium]
MSKKGFSRAESCIIYARQSSGKEEDSESIEMQLRKCGELAQKMGLEVVGEYFDANSSGRLYPVGAENIARQDIVFKKWIAQQSSEKRFRPGLGKVISSLHKVKYIIVDDLTRIARPLSGSFLNDYIKQNFQNSNVIIVTVKNGPVDYGNYMDCLVSDVQTHVVDNQLRIQTQKTIDALKEIKDNGYYPTRPQMFGIEYVGGKEREIRVIPECAEVIRFIFDEITNLRPYNAVIQEINGKWRHLFRKMCYDSSFRHIAEQPFYAGYMYNSKGELIAAKQMQGKEIISYSQWKKVQEILAAKRTLNKREKFRDLPFSGLLRCGCCGAKLVSGFEYGKSFYYCDAGANALRQQGCRHARLNVTMVRNAPDYTGLRQAVTPLLLLAQFKMQEEELNLQNKYRTIASLRAELSRSRERLNECCDAFMESGMSRKEFVFQLKRLSKPIDALQAEIRELEILQDDRLGRSSAVSGYRLTAGMVRSGAVSDTLYRKLLWDSISKIDCFYDHVIIHTVCGTFRLDRYMEYHFRNFPKYELKIVSGDPDDPLSCCYALTYLYSKSGNITPIADLGAVRIYARK